jgi:prepilin-type processing-associated H-X9-DG protein
VLPFIEEAATYDSARSYFKNTGGANGGSVAGWRGLYPNGVKLAAILCPSDPMTFSSDVQWPTNYRACAGDVTYQMGSQGFYPHEAQILYCCGGVALNGESQYGTSPRSAIGVSFPKRITDGLSKTVLVGEAVIGDGTESRLTGFARVAGYNDNSKPQACLAASFVTTAPGYRNAIGWVWPAAAAGHTMFYNSLPPNGPRCSRNNQTDSEAGVPASSHHPGGAVVAMCDGAVRFIDQSIDTNNSPDQTISSVSYLRAKSVYGVWGAMATPNQYETYSY